MRIPKDVMVRIEDWRRRQTVVPSPVEAVRQLIDRGLASAPVPAIGPPPTGKQRLCAPVPVAKPARTYADESIYSPAVRPVAGYPWEKRGHDASDGFNTKQPCRLIEKVRWLADQFTAAGKPTTLRKLVEDILQDFVDRELKTWGVPPEYLD